MATRSSILAWRIPETEEPGGLPPMGLHRVGHDWSDLAAAAAAATAAAQTTDYWCRKQYHILSMNWNGSKKKMPLMEHDAIDGAWWLCTVQEDNAGHVLPVFLFCFVFSPLLWWKIWIDSSAFSHPVCFVSKSAYFGDSWLRLAGGKVCGHGTEEFKPPKPTILAS